MEKTYEDGLRDCLKIIDEIYGKKFPNKRLRMKVAIMKKLFNVPIRRKDA